MFTKFVDVKNSEGSLLVFDTDTQQFKFHYENVYDNERMQCDNDDICDEIFSWGFDDLDDFFASNPAIVEYDGIALYWLEA